MLGHFLFADDKVACLRRAYARWLLKARMDYAQVSEGTCQRQLGTEYHVKYKEAQLTLLQSQPY